jgi:Fic family protein
MELPKPCEMDLDAVSTQLIEDVAELADEVNNFRPLPPDVIDKIHKELLGERIYNSNAIEGNSLTLRETIRILESGHLDDGGKQRDATEVINLGKAIERIQSIASDGFKVSDRQQFLEVHKQLLTGIQDDSAGLIRHEDVMIRGAKHQPPSGFQVSKLLDACFSNLRDSRGIEPIRRATWIHWAIARIHPFYDGNGRMARLWQDLVLFEHRYTAAVIRATERHEYYNALAGADDGNFNPLTQFIARSVASSLQIYINAARESDELKGWAAELVGETHARLDEQRKLEYLRWSRMMNQLQDAFRRCATQVTDASDGTVEVQLRPFDIVDQSTWESLRSGTGASKTWYFWLHFRRGSERVQYCFFFGHHLDSEADHGIGPIGPSVCLLISEQQGRETARRIDEIPGTPITLREVLMVEGQLSRKRRDLATESEVYDMNIDPLKIAREFLAEVLLKRLP